MARRLVLTLTTEGNGSMDISIVDPIENITMTTINEAVTKIWPVMITNAGAAATGLKSASIETTTKEKVPEA